MKYTIMVTILILIMLGLAVESTMLFLSFIYADKIECNFLWCTFTTVKESNLNMIQNCYMNGQPINCSKIPSFTNYTYKP